MKFVYEGGDTNSMIQFQFGLVLWFVIKMGLLLQGLRGQDGLQPPLELGAQEKTSSSLDVDSSVIKQRLKLVFILLLPPPFIFILNIAFMYLHCSYLLDTNFPGLGSMSGLQTYLMSKR